MKADIHPKIYNVCFEDVSTNKRFLTTSTTKSRHGKKVTIDGIEYEHIIADITSDSHPVYTGEKRFVDSAGRVEKFQNKFRKRK